MRHGKTHCVSAIVTFILLKKNRLVGSGEYETYLVVYSDKTFFSSPRPVDCAVVDWTVQAGHDYRTTVIVRLYHRPAVAREAFRFLEDQEDLEQLSVSATDNAGNDSCDEAGESSEDVGISLDWKPGIRSETLSDFPDQYRQSYSTSQDQCRQSYPTSQADIGQFDSRSIVIKEDLDAESPTRIVEVPSEMKNSAERLGSEDRFDLIGKTIALKLRNLPKGQMLIAENLIHQVLFQAELETLSFQHRIVGETRRNQDEYCYQAQNSTE
ncbi:unnamed protein product [Nesidiocoris tenuis]|uniref:BESS domain-containing protein n=1 Tax=Nesidiocoris tenuis TaxID=355587 RepID=A0A6H5G0W9_9HEMI|nr:unnamed protein product [Nesidiocoris tenuis]